MNDPHVNSIRYNLKTSEHVSYEHCAIINKKTNEYELILTDGILAFNFVIHFADVASACSFVQPILKTWEIDVALQYGRGELEFTFLDEDLIDRNPPLPGSVIQASASLQCSAALNASVHVTRTKYPNLPTKFMATPDVESLWYRFEMYLEGREQLSSMAYFCLSYIEGLAGSRNSVQNAFGINRIVLDKLGDLTSARGDEKTARKGKGHGFLALTKPETTWVEECAKIIIRRVGEHAYDSCSLTLITMADLPVV